MTKNLTNFYCVGGTMEPDDKSYVPRDTDEILYEHLAAGDFCYVLNPRQVGKSSLMIRVAQALKEAKINVAIVDLQPISRSLSDEKWYYAVLKQIGSSLGLDSELRDHWLQGRQVSGQTESDADLVSPLERWIKALKEIVLPKCPGRLVIFVDEIDSVRSYTKFTADEFFAAIRFLFNEQRLNSELKRLSFCLIGVATPSDLIKDTRVTPFNVGERIELRDFKESEAQRLAAHLGRDKKTNAKLLKRVLYWTGGHPYLTQRFCSAVAADSSVTGARAIDRLCRELFLSPDARGKDTNILFVRDRMLLQESAEREPRANRELMGLLSLYSQIHKGKRIPDDETNPLISILRLSGIVSAKNGILTTRNRIYQNVFNQKWIKANKPDAELQKQKAIYRRRLAAVASLAVVIITALSSLAIYARAQRTEAVNKTKDLETTLARLRQAQSDLGRREAEVIEGQQSITHQKDQIAIANNSLREKEDVIKEQTKVAREKTLEANRQQNLARIMSERAAEQTKNSRHFLYASKVKLASSLYKDGNIDAFSELLNDTEPDLRGFEWNYFNHFLSASLLFEEDAAGSVIFGNSVISPDRKILVFGGLSEKEDRAVLLLNLAKPEERKILKDMGTSFAFSPDGKLLASIDHNGQIFLCDTTTWKPVRFVPVADSKRSNPPNSYFPMIAFTADGKRLLTLEQQSREVTYWDIETRKQVRETISTGDEFTINSISPDGRYLALSEGPSGNFAPQGISLWDVAKRKVIPLERFGDGSVFPYGFTFSPRGNRLAVGELDLKSITEIKERITIWDVTTGRKINTVTDYNSGIVIGHGPPVFSGVEIVFSSNEKHLAVSNSNNLVRVFDIDENQIIKVIEQKSGDITALAFSPDNTKVIAVGYNGQTAKWFFKVWAASKQQNVFSFDNETFHAATTDGTKVITSQNQAWTLWDVLKEKRIRVEKFDSSASNKIVFSPSGKHFSTYDKGGDKTVLRLWDAATGDEVSLRSGSLCVVSQRTGFSSAGTILGATCKDGTIRLWDTETGKEIRKLADERRFDYEIGFVQLDNKTLALEYSESEDIRIWNIKSKKPIPNRYFENTKIISFSPDGRWLVTRDKDRKDTLLDTTTGRGTALKYENPIATVFSDDGRFFAIANRELISLTDLVTQKEILLNERDQSDGSKYAEVGFSPSSRWLLIGVRYGEIAGFEVWDTKARRKVQFNDSTRKLSVRSLSTFVFSADETRLLTGYSDGTVKLWDMITGQELLSLVAHDNTVTAITLFRDNKFLLTGSFFSASPGKARLWKTQALCCEN